MESDDHGFFLKPLGMMMLSGSGEKHLNAEGAAEYYWSVLMELLQRRR